MDDDTQLATARLQRTRKIFDRAEVFVLLVEAGRWTDYETAILTAARQSRCPCLIMVNKIDINPPEADFMRILQEASPFVGCVFQPCGA